MNGKYHSTCDNYADRVLEDSSLRAGVPARESASRSDSGPCPATARMAPVLVIEPSAKTARWDRRAARCPQEKRELRALALSLRPTWGSLKCQSFA